MATDPKLRRPTPHGAFASAKPAAPAAEHVATPATSRQASDQASQSTERASNADKAPAQASQSPQQGSNREKGREVSPTPDSGGTIVGLGFGLSRPPLAGAGAGAGQAGARRATMQMPLAASPPSAGARTEAHSPSPKAEDDERDAWAPEASDGWATETTSTTLRPGEVAKGLVRRRVSAAVTVRPGADDAWPPTDPHLGEPAAQAAVLNLVDRTEPAERLDLEGEMLELFALDDLTGALRLADMILGRDPDHQRAQHCAADCRERLASLYASKLGDLNQSVHVALPDNEVRWLGLDHRAGFVLSRVDGMTSVDELLDVSGMPRLEGLKILVELLDRGAIRLDP